MRFAYEALTREGKRKTGEIEVEHIEGAKEKIRNEGLYLISLKEKAEERKERSLSFGFGLKRKLPLNLSRQLSSLLKGGVPLYQALLILENQTKSEKERKILHFLSDRVKEGTSLSDALKEFPNIFDDFFIYSVKAGERTGSLDKILSYQANLLERDANLRSRVKAALAYPIIMICVGISVLFFLLSVVVPMMMKIFERMNQTLPLPTRMLIGISEFMTGNLFLIVAGILLLIGFLRKIRKNKGWNRFKTFLILRLPLIGELYEMIVVARFSRILSTLLRSGVPMLQSLLVVEGAVKNPVYGDGIRRMAEMVEGGMDLSVAIKQTNLFPYHIGDMVSVGEKGGNLEEMLDNISESYESSISQKITALTALIEPFIILSLGAFVAFVVVSTLLPLFEMNKLLLKR